MSVAGVNLPRHLDLIATAPDGIRKLRGLILELAVRGKLVAQDPKDEPASELLKRIAVERARLAAEGTCKKSKAAPPVGEDEQPFALPRGWEWSRLAGVAVINPRNAADDSIIASFVPMAMIGTGFNGAHSHEPRKWGEIKQGFTHFAEGDIGVAKITPCFENSKACVFVKLQNGLGAGTTELHIVRPIGSTLVPRYVLAYLKAPMFLLVGETRMTGTAGQKRLPKEFLETNPFPLPPLAEQHRIVAKVDELMALCDRLEAEQADAGAAHARLVATLLGTLTQSTGAAELAANWQRLAAHFDTLFTIEASLDALKQTILQLAVMGKLVPQDPNDEPASELLKRIAKERARLQATGKFGKSKQVLPVGETEWSFELPNGWEWTSVDSISSVGTGTTPSRTNPSYFDPPLIPWVTSGETRDPFIGVTAEKVSPLALKETNLTVYPVGTLIVAMYGQGKTRGQVSELQIEAATNQACSAIIPALPDRSFRKYIKLFFEKIYDEIREEAAGGAQPNLNVGKIKATLVSLPPLAEQHRIVAKVDELLALVDRLQADLADSRARQERLAATLIESALQTA